MTPDEFTNQELMLPVGDGHELYIHDWGNNEAKTPIIFLHGGPGSSSRDKYKTTFDPLKHRVIFFDQRGSGKSTPYGSLENNTTEKLVGDIDQILEHFDLEKVILFGRSWGSTLALAYALHAPEKVQAIVTGGIFTGSSSEVDWINNGEFRTFFPDVWNEYLARTPEDKRDNPSQYHTEKALGKDLSQSRQSAFALDQLEGALLRLDDRWGPFTLDEDFDPSGAIIETHYLSQLCFMPDNHILNNAASLTMPIWIVQGRYDMVCPPVTAYELHQKLPNSHLIWTQAGHSGNDRENWLATKTILAQF